MANLNKLQERFHMPWALRQSSFTSIQQADVDGARTYRGVGDELRTFAVSYPNAAWASWDNYDARQLGRDAAFAGSPFLLEGLPHSNARKWHAGSHDDRPKSLKQTVESLGLFWQGTFHRGIDDARNAASIIKEILG